MQDTVRHSVTLVLGGVRSGKSRYAQQMGLRYESVAYIATAQATDEEMSAKISRHKQDRPQHWRTIEEPLSLDLAIQSAAKSNDFIIVDCLTVWAGNLLHAESDHFSIEARVQALCNQLQQMACPLVIVSNEVGSGVVPAYALGRRYRDLLGEINQRVAVVATNAIFWVAGLPLVLKGTLEKNS